MTNYERKMTAITLSVLLAAVTVVFAFVFLAPGSGLEPGSESGYPDRGQTLTVSAVAAPSVSDEPIPSIPHNPDIKEPEDEMGKMNTVKKLLSAALEPIGSCLYIYGGGWNEEDTAAGVEALSYGVSPRWREFFNENSGSYDYKNHMFSIHDGLDCTGYVGYTLYQVFGDSHSDTGYVFPSREFSQGLLALLGGSITPCNEITKRLPGDIMAKDGHVFIVIGECEDGSVLLTHASPPNVTLSGTPTPNGIAGSEAFSLAHEYMEKIAPEAHSRYENCSRDMSYLREYDLYRLDFDVLADPDGYRSMTPSEIMADLTSSRSK